MKAYVGEVVLILAIALCAHWTNIVNGAAAEQETTRQALVQEQNEEGSADQSTDEPATVNTERPIITNLLPSVMQRITYMTGKPFIMLHVPVKELYTNISRLLATNETHCEENSNGTKLTCKLEDNSNRILTLGAVTRRPPRVYLAVHQARTNISIDNTHSEIETYCKHTSTCPTCSQTTQSTTCPQTTTNTTCPPTTQCPEQTTMDGRITENHQGSPCDMTGQDTQQSIGDSVMPVIIASIVSFIAGIGVCLLVLCLIGHFHGRLCLTFTSSNKYVEKTAKSENQAPKSKIYTTSTIDMTEHEYLDLRCETMPHPDSKLEDVSSRGQKQPSAPNTATPTPMYETMASAQKEHVYSGLGKTEPNLETEYEHTSPNRSSEHMYSGMVHDKQSSDPTILQQVNTPDGIANTNGNQMHNTGDNEVGPNNYFVLEKEQHSTNQSKPGQGQGLDFGDIETAEDTDDYHSYHTLQKI